MWFWLGKMLGVIPQGAKRPPATIDEARLEVRTQKARRQEDLSRGFKELVERRAARQKQEE